MTPIDLIEFQYSLSKKNNISNATATAIQFPLRLAFAATAHKVQGLTVKKPNHLVIDLRKVREPAQAYVILSRVQSLCQLFIMVSVCENKMMASAKAMEELERMERVSLRQKLTRRSILSCNIRSIKKNFENFATASAVKNAQVMCLQETWIDPLAPQTNLLESKCWNQHNNSIGKGKGITTLYKQIYVWVRDVTEMEYQITKIKSDSMDVINVYRSAGADDECFLEDLCSLVSSGKQTLILGDFNICYQTQPTNQVFQALESKGFKQLVKHPTHIEGRLIDLVFIFSMDPGVNYEALQQAQYFTDHDMIEVFRGIKYGLLHTDMNTVSIISGSHPEVLE